MRRTLLAWGLACAALLAQPAAGQLWLTHGEASEYQGEPAVRFQVWHQHGMMWCTGHLYFTRTQVGFQVLGPERYRTDAFSQPRENVRIEFRGLQKVSGGRFSIGPLTAPRGQALRVQTGGHHKGRRYDFFLASGISPDGTAKLDSVSLLPVQEAWENFELAWEHARTRWDPNQPRPAPAVSSSAASLEILVEPVGTALYLNDEYKGRTNSEGRLKVSELAAGEYRLRLTHDGYEEWTRSVTLAAGETRSIEVELDAAAPPQSPGVLGFEEVLKLLESGVTPARLETIVKERGVSFARDDQAEQKLRQAGATAELLLAIAKAKK